MVRVAVSHYHHLLATCQNCQHTIQGEEKSAQTVNIPAPSPSTLSDHPWTRPLGRQRQREVWGTQPAGLKRVCLASIIKIATEKN